MRKKVLAFLMVVACLVSIFGTTSAALAAATPTTPANFPFRNPPTAQETPRQGEASIGGYRLSQGTLKNSTAVYASPDTSSSKMLSFKTGDTVLMIGAPKDGWQLVKIGSDYGYIKSSAVNQSSQITVPEDARFGTVRVSANIRSKANSTSTKLSVGRQGGDIAIVGESGRYYKVTFATKSGIKTGYILKKYVTIE